MTKNEFIEHLKSIDLKLYNNLSLGNVELPKIVDMFAEECFINKINENEHTEALREQLINIHKIKGYFVFD